MLHGCVRTAFFKSGTSEGRSSWISRFRIRTSWFIMWFYVNTRRTCTSFDLFFADDQSMNVSVRGIARISAYEGVIASQTACLKCSSSLGMLLFIMRMIMHFGGTVHFLVVFPEPDLWCLLLSSCNLLEDLGSFGYVISTFVCVDVIPTGSVGG